MIRVEMEEDWGPQLPAGIVELFNERLGPAIRDDAKAFAPVDTGRLEGSIGHQVVVDTGRVELQVGSFPDDEGPVEYAPAVELGFHGDVSVRAHTRRGRDGAEHPVREYVRRANTPEQPYLRPALYQERGE